MVKNLQKKEMKSLTIFIPFYNEEEVIPPLCSRLIPVINLLKKKWSIQLVLVDDGSIDATHSQLIRHFSAIPSIISVILRHSQNQGIGGAMRTGFEAATGDLVCTLDSDCTYAPEKLPEMIQLLMEEPADIVTGSPYHPQGRVENVNPKRLLLSKTASIMYSFLVPTKLHCYTSFFRVYRRQWAQTNLFNSSGFLAVTEVLLSAASEGARIVEFPVSMGSRSAGQSKMKVAKVTLDHLQLMSRTAINNVLPGSSRRHQSPQRDLVSAYPLTAITGERRNQTGEETLLKEWVLVGRAEYRPSGGIRRSAMPRAR